MNSAFADFQILLIHFCESLGFGSNLDRPRSWNVFALECCKLSNGLFTRSKFGRIKFLFFSIGYNNIAKFIFRGSKYINLVSEKCGKTQP